MRDPLRERVQLSDPSPAWRQQFVDHEAEIRAALSALSPTVEHIGSTSVPLRAKPIVDIQVAVDASHRADAVGALERLGYRHHGEAGVPGREYFTRRPGAGPAVNVHLFAAGSPTLEDNRLIRDYLRAHPDVAADYVRDKEQAVRQGHTDLAGYSDAKAAAVAAIRDAARAWARSVS